MCQIPCTLCDNGKNKALFEEAKKIFGSTRKEKWPDPFRVGPFRFIAFDFILPKVRRRSRGKARLKNRSWTSSGFRGRSLSCFVGLPRKLRSWPPPRSRRRFGEKSNARPEWRDP